MLVRRSRPVLLAACIALVFMVIVFIALHTVSASSSTILISAVYYDTYLSGEPDESFRLTNVSASAVDLTNWTVTDGEGIITLTVALTPGVVSGSPTRR